MVRLLNDKSDNGEKGVFLSNFRPLNHMWLLFYVSLCVSLYVSDIRSRCTKCPIAHILLGFL